MILKLHFLFPFTLQYLICPTELINKHYTQPEKHLYTVHCHCLHCQSMAATSWTGIVPFTL